MTDCKNFEISTWEMIRNCEWTRLFADRNEKMQWRCTIEFMAQGCKSVGMLSDSTHERQSPKKNALFIDVQGPWLHLELDATSDSSHTFVIKLNSTLRHSIQRPSRRYFSPVGYDSLRWFALTYISLALDGNRPIRRTISRNDENAFG